MKKYSVCFFVLIITSIICIVTGYTIRRVNMNKAEEITVESSQTESASVQEREVSAGQKMVKPTVEKHKQNNYYLVSEAGNVLVFYKDRNTICLYTHIPVTDFPEMERARLMEGIWFEKMKDVLNYLESYTS